MFKVLLKTSVRNILRNGANSSINLLTLTIGITVSIVVFTVIKYQYTFDHFHTNADRVYRVNFLQQNDWGTNYSSQTPEPLHKVLRNDYPQIEAVSRTIGPMEVRLFVDDEKFDQQMILFVDKHFFKMFDQDWVRGDKANVFEDPKAVILTESTAKKLFGDEDPMGKTIDFTRRELGVVRGIVKDPRLNTNLPYTMIANVAMMKQVQEFYVREEWDVTSIGTTWVLLPENVSVESLQSQMQDIIVQNFGEEAAQFISFNLGALKTLHTDDKFEGVNYTIPKETVYGLVIVALFVLLTCSINFINLSTAYALKRSQEIGIKKILGSSKGHLAAQFFLELSLLTLVAGFLSLWFAEILLNQINYALSLVSMDLFLEWQSVIFALFLVLGITFFAGLYPAILLVNFKPLEVMRSKFTQLRGNKAFIRNTLLTVQFVFAQVLVIVLLIFNAQFSYIKNKDLGYETDNIVMFRDFMKSGYMVDQTQLNAAKAQLLASPYIEKVSYGTGGPNANFAWSTSCYLPSQGERSEIQVDYKHVDIDYLDMFKLEMIAGNWFTSTSYVDPIQNVIVTKLLTEKLGWANPADAIGERLIMNGAEGKIVGVLADFHSENLKNTIRPSVFESDYEGYNQGFMKVKEGHYAEAMAFFEQVSTKDNQDYIPGYETFSSELERDYLLDKIIFQFINFVAFLALAIGSLGLYSLISFVAQQKTKEIGIRKVVGANVQSLMLLLSSKYVWLILLSTVLASPLAYYGAEEWLNGFAYRIDISPLIFLIAFMLTSAIAILSVGYRAYKAAMLNPVKSLRYD
ncbi:MAG: hypothetical protein COW03_05190 [Cytophagales bacterium CG12_big_fil_rev_8_21_14_0_65_40_12]|nr:MAG: hypothetical protein COW03_05190 [Cytophagales bacterium CG12_big_fil_rev_8_21_14_0_65_40_12]PIW05131.1 MAG: hypothetical protein COW40_06575 [Cytophagales bacterium CG17_big_fil_post_rev_8_21_14_2_50_40_13]